MTLPTLADIHELAQQLRVELGPVQHRGRVRAIRRRACRPQT